MAQDGGLTLREVVSSIPVDPAAIIAYLLVAGFIGIIWYGNRRSRSGTPTGPRGASTSIPESPERTEHKRS
jgi:hypothetical protein